MSCELNAQKDPEDALSEDDRIGGIFKACLQCVIPMRS